ncbi:MAG: hypothetical protein J7L78_04580 [Dehalococcoidales bacterium]|nr:hypothetical protein [Dehalococcoidales bacterium]
MRKVFSIAGLLVLVAALLMLGCAKPAPAPAPAPAPEMQYKWKMVSEEMEGDYMTYWSQQFADEMSEWSDGQIEITVCPYGTLGEITD